MRSLAIKIFIGLFTIALNSCHPVALSDNDQESTGIFQADGGDEDVPVDDGK